MIFHVTRNDECGPVDFFLRVIGPVRKGKYNGPKECKCKWVYRVVMKSIGREHVRQGAYRDGQKYVCECHGGIHE